MASDKNFVEFVVDQIENAGVITYDQCLGNTEFTLMEKYLD